jgi:hypothetical protein
MLLQVIDIPWQLHAATVAESLPIVAAAVVRRRGGQFPRARLLLLVWCVAVFLSDIAGYLTLSSATANSNPNLWLRAITHPLMQGMMLWTLAHWQLRSSWRRVLLVSAVVLPVVWLAIAWDEGLGTFGPTSGSLETILLLAASLFTLVTRSAFATDRLVREDWFWTSLGLSIYYATTAALWSFAQYAYPEHPELIRLAWRTKATVDILAFLIITYGVLCPVPRQASGSSGPHPQPL